MKVPGIEGNYIWKYPHFAIRDPKSGKANLTDEQVMEIRKEAIAFMASYKKWFTMAKETLIKALDEKKITDRQYCTFLDRQSSNMKAIKTIFEKTQTGEVYFDAKGFEKENINSYETKRVYLELSRIGYYLKSLENEKDLEKDENKIATNSNEIYEGEENLDINLNELQKDNNLNGSKTDYTQE